jgi:uncharacterized protein YneF (UPF0154 family)
MKDFLADVAILSLVNHEALPALRIAGTIFLIIFLLGGFYIFRNRHRFFDKDPDIAEDIPAVRKIRAEEILMVWGALTILILVTLISLWRQ